MGNVTVTTDTDVTVSPDGADTSVSTPSDVVTIATGEQGPPGPQGIPGVEGDTGPVGPVGPPGPLGGTFPDAPSDGTFYGRLNGAWSATIDMGVY